MALASGQHVGPWEEADLARLPEDGQRYELLSGALVVGPPPGGLHQLLCFKLASILHAHVPEGLVMVEALGVRAAEGSVLIPDVLVADREAVVASQSGILDPGSVRLVVEVVSPGSRAQDRLTKPALYAAAGIPAYWRVEPDEGPAVHTFQLDAGRYTPAGTAAPGVPLDVQVPFPVRIDAAGLQP